MTPRKLKLCESGEDQLTFPQLIQTSRAYKRPVAAFYLDELPQEIEIPDFRRLPQSQTSSFSPKLRIAIRRIHYQKQVAEQLASYGKQANLDFIGQIDLDWDPERAASWIRELLAITLEVQRKWKDQYQAFNGWRKAIENIGVLVFLLQGISIGEMRGFAIVDPPYPAIALNRADTPAPRSFTLIHEFCHIILKKSGVCPPFRIQKRFAPEKVRNFLQSRSRCSNRTVRSVIEQSSSKKPRSIKRLGGC